jgi:glycerol-3-phosphate dehydrogenase (NAD(P)+)
MTKVAILGGGSWGTGLSVVLGNSRRSHEIGLWARESSVVETIKNDRENQAYLPGVVIPSCVTPSTDLHEVLDQAHLVVGVVPSAHAREVFKIGRAHV